MLGPLPISIHALSLQEEGDSGLSVIYDCRDDFRASATSHSLSPRPVPRRRHRRTVVGKSYALTGDRTFCHR